MNLSTPAKLDRQKRFYTKNRAYILEYQRTYHLNNRARHRARYRKYYLKNRDKIKAANKAWRNLNHKKIESIQAAWRSRNRVKLRVLNQVWRRHAVQNLTAPYVKHLLIADGVCRGSTITQELIELKRMQLNLSRTIRKLNKQT